MLLLLVMVILVMRKTLQHITRASDTAVLIVRAAEPDANR